MMTKKYFILIFVFVCIGKISAQFSDNIKVMTYNLLQYGITAGPNCTPSTVTNKNIWLNTILGYYKPDLLAVNELRWNSNSAYAQNIKQNVLNNYNAAMNITISGNSTNSDIVNMLFFNSNKFGYLSHQAITGNVRDIDVYELYHLSSSKAIDTNKLWVLVAHLKAGNTSADANARGVAAEDVMDWLAGHSHIQNYLLMGDFNLYSSTEAAYQIFTDALDPMRFYDPTGITTGWGGSNYKSLHTQCPSTSTANCFSGGGLDDRFDFILMSKSIKDNTAGIGYKSGTYKAFGNDGVSYNAGLNCGATTSIPAAVCNTLTQNSDHLPVVMELEIATTVGIQNAVLQGVEMNILENPVIENILKLQFVFPEKKTENYQLSILDMMGQTVYDMSISSNDTKLDIPVSALSNGMYHLILKEKNGKFLSHAFVK